MSAVRPQRKPTFFWQGVFIMLPVVALALVSWISLHQDEQAAEKDARNRAAAEVQSLARAMRSPVDEELHRFLILQNTWMLELHSASQPSVSGAPFPDAKLQADIEKWERDYPGLMFAEMATPSGAILADGRQIQPPDFSAAPVPPKWFRELSPEQIKLWDSLRAARSQSKIDSQSQFFLDSQTSAAAQQALFDLFQPPEQMIGHSNFLPSETGITFEEIACYKMLSATNARLTDSLLQSVWWRVFDQPSIVSPKLLELAGSLTNQANTVLQQKFVWMQTLFASQSKVHELLSSLRTVPDLHPWKKLWWSHWTKNDAALAVFQPTTYVNPGEDGNGVSLSGQGYAVSFLPRQVVEAIFNRALAENQFLVPAFAAPMVTVGNLRLSGTREPVPADEKLLLGGAEQKAGGYFAQNAIRYEVQFFLTSREQLLSAERRRAKLFGALILGAVLTAFIGLLAARRAFKRQLEFNELKTNFVSSVSHELRAPIAAVRLMAENLETGKISHATKQNEYFRFIVQECRRLSSLIENVLDFSRIEQGRKQYEFEPTNLAALTETTVKLMAPYAAEKGVRLELKSEIGNRKSEIDLDGRAIQQALVNLIDNAIKHSAKGQTVTVGIEVQNSVGTSLFVADQGPGIPPAEQEKIFERFYRRGSELRRETQGIGIGLSIVKHIIEAHGGRVTVDSEPGKGSRFTIVLSAPK